VAQGGEGIKLNPTPELCLAISSIDDPDTPYVTDPPPILYVNVFTLPAGTVILRVPFGSVPVNVSPVILTWSFVVYPCSRTVVIVTSPPPALEAADITWESEFPLAVT
jgi:hypothetical protein